MFNSTDWNKHNEIGGVLIENWVEERAAKEFIIQERMQGSALDRNGHMNILSINETREFSTTSRDSYKSFPVQKVAAKKQEQPLKAMLEKTWMNEIEKKLEEAETMERMSNMGPTESSSKAAFAHKDIYSNIEYLGEFKPSSIKVEEFKHPITFWSEKVGNGTLCSVQKNEYDELRGKNAASFGKHAAFTTPIEDESKQYTLATKIPIESAFNASLTSLTSKRHKLGQIHNIPMFLFPKRETSSIWLQCTTLPVQIPLMNLNDILLSVSEGKRKVGELLQVMTQLCVQNDVGVVAAHLPKICEFFFSSGPFDSRFSAQDKALVMSFLSPSNNFIGILLKSVKEKDLNYSIDVDNLPSVIKKLVKSKNINVMPKAILSKMHYSASPFMERQYKLRTSNTSEPFKMMNVNPMEYFIYLFLTCALQSTNVSQSSFTSPSTQSVLQQDASFLELFKQYIEFFVPRHHYYQKVVNSTTSLSPPGSFEGKGSDVFHATDDHVSSMEHAEFFIALANELLFSSYLNSESLIKGNSIQHGLIWINHVSMINSTTEVQTHNWETTKPTLTQAYTKIQRKVQEVSGKYLYHFLKWNMENINDSEFGKVVSAWLTYITPWDPADTVLFDWHSFIQHNFPFYTFLFSLFLSRNKTEPITKTTPSPNITLKLTDAYTLTCNVLSVFSNKPLLHVLQSIETALTSLDTFPIRDLKPMSRQQSHARMVSQETPQSPLYYKSSGPITVSLNEYVRIGDLRNCGHAVKKCIQEICGVDDFVPVFNIEEREGGIFNDVKIMGTQLHVSIKKCQALCERYEILQQEADFDKKKKNFWSYLTSFYHFKEEQRDKINILEVESVRKSLRACLGSLQSIYGTVDSLFEEQKPEPFMSRVHSNADLRVKRRGVWISDRKEVKVIQNERTRAIPQSYENAYLLKMILYMVTLLDSVVQSYREKWENERYIGFIIKRVPSFIWLRFFASIGNCVLFAVGLFFTWLLSGVFFWSIGLFLGRSDYEASRVGVASFSRGNNVGRKRVIY